MFTECVVEITKCGESTESVGEVAGVSVVEGDGLGATVKAGCRKDAVGKAVFEVCISEKEGLQGLSKVPVELWSKRCKGTWRFHAKLVGLNWEWAGALTRLKPSNPLDAVGSKHFLDQSAHFPGMG